jgi:7-cyano-7-deazaguanine synthase
MSGGIDSSACAHHFLRQGHHVQGLFIDYGQAAGSSEAAAVAKIADHLDVGLRTAQFAGLGPLGAGELSGRNGFMVFAALFLTGGQKGLIGLGLHAGTPYYDCSARFLGLIDALVAEHTDGKVRVVAPFIQWSKQEVYDYAVAAGLPLASTYSCEAGSSIPCGHCASCRDREALGC